MIFSMKFLIFTFKEPNWAGKSDKFGRNSRGSWGLLFQLKEPLALGGFSVPPSTKVVVIRIVEGNWSQLVR